MRTRPLALAATVLALAGCVVAPGAVPTTPPAAGVEAAAADTLPFRTLLADDGAHGVWFAAGPDERVVLRSAADLAGLLARHARPGDKPRPLPEALTTLDWGAWQAVALVDGAVDEASTSRITAIADLGDRLVVHPTRWDAAPGERKGPSATSRVHIVAIPRTERAIAFAMPAVQTLAGGGFARVTWKAVQNPLQTREQAELGFQRGLGGQAITSRSFERRTLAWVKANLVPDYPLDQHFTPDSEVWVGVAEGRFANPLGASTGARPNIGGDEPMVTKVISLYSIETDFPWLLYQTGSGPDPRPGFSFELDPASDLVLNGTLRLKPSNDVPAPPGALTLTVQAGAGVPVVREVRYVDLAAFALPLDAATIPGLTDAAVQPLSIVMRYENRPGQAGELRHDTRLLRDRDTKPTPPQRAMGPDDAAQYRTRPGEEPWDAMAREIAEGDWQGRGVTSSAVMSTRAAIAGAKSPRPVDPATPVKVFTFRGTFPKVLVDATVSGTGQDDVFAPRRLVVAVTAGVPVVVLEQRAFAD